MWKAVGELERIAELEAQIEKLEEENEKMKAILNSVAESNTYAYLLDAQKKAKSFFEE